eukprot:TRINITY_DN1914_c0_g1_i1.p1 TRINITY_DN1914_c0_g1~~TRINITY_DN1914_c0_g1_i1.p1  ORF type:complete len:344 (+),score=60.43 TRINITY_DN1914_c0_g1_i1:233-1264(+)
MDEILTHRYWTNDGLVWSQKVNKSERMNTAELLGLVCTRRNVDSVLRPYLFMVSCVLGLSSETVSRLLPTWEPMVDTKQLAFPEARKLLARRFVRLVDWVHSDEATIKTIAQELRRLNLPSSGSKDVLTARLLIGALPFPPIPGSAAASVSNAPHFGAAPAPVLGGRRKSAPKRKQRARSPLRMFAVNGALAMPAALGIRPASISVRSNEQDPDASPFIIDGAAFAESRTFLAGIADDQLPQFASLYQIDPRLSAPILRMRLLPFASQIRTLLSTPELLSLISRRAVVSLPVEDSRPLGARLATPVEPKSAPTTDAAAAAAVTAATGSAGSVLVAVSKEDANQ